MLSFWITIAAVAGPANAAAEDVPSAYASAWESCRNEKLDFSSDGIAAELKGCDALIAAKDVDNEIKAIAHTNRGMLMSQSSFFVTAKDELDTAIKLNPRLAPAFYNRALLHQSLKEFSAAIDDYSAAIAIKPTMVEAYVNRGIVYAQAGKSDLAIADFSKEIELEPKVADGFSNRAIARARAGQLDGALADFTQAIALEPSADHYADRARLLRKLGRDADAAADEAKAQQSPGSQ